MNDDEVYLVFAGLVIMRKCLASRHFQSLANYLSYWLNSDRVLYKGSLLMYHRNGLL